MIMPPDLVLFDCDGVLVDSEIITNSVLQRDLAGRGLKLELSEVMSLFVGGTMAGVMQTAWGMGADLPDDWLDVIYPKIYDALAREVTPVPGIMAVLDALDARGVGYAVGSNGRQEKMEITLTRTGLIDRFRGRLYSGQECAHPKPAPDVYLKAAADAGVAPARAVVIEDSASGAKAGVSAGMYCLGFVAETDPAVLAPICDGLFGDMTDLPGMLGLTG